MSLQRNRSIPPRRQSTDGFVPQGQGKRLRKKDAFDEPFMQRRRREPSKQVQIGDVYRPKQLIKDEKLGDGKEKTSRRQLKKLAKQSKKSSKNQDVPKESKEPKRKRRIFRLIIIILLVVLLAVGGYLGFKAYSKLRNVFRGGGSSAVVCGGEVSPDVLKTEGDGRVNILILGIGGAEQPDGPNLTDTIMIASLNPLNNSVKLLSVPRDLWVDIGGSYHKINEAYQTGLYAYQRAYPKETDAWPAIQAGFKEANNVVSAAIGIPINYDVLISYKGFTDAIKAVGGIDVNVPETVYDATMAWENGGSSVIARKGEQHMDSKQALMYVRTRHGSDRGDFDRAERQRAVLVALQEKVLSAGTLVNPVKVNDLLNALGDNIRTNIGGEERTCLMNAARKVDGDSVKSIDLYDYVGGATSDQGMSIQVPKAGLHDFSQLQSYVRNELRDSYLAKENAAVMVLNASGQAGLATQVADELKSYGYRVTAVDMAPTSGLTQTKIVDVSKKDTPIYTLHYLQRRLGAPVSKDLPAGIEQGDAKIVILVGSDAEDYR